MKLPQMRLTIKSAFTRKAGQCFLTRTPFSLSGAQNTFQRAMKKVIRNVNWQACVLFMNDILVFGRILLNS